MNDPQLKSFIQVADEGSFSKAAEILYLSSTAIIKQINALELELSAQLFYRTPQGLSLTEGGKSFYADAHKLLQYSEEAKQRAQDAMKHSSYTIRIGTSFLNPVQFLVNCWPAIQELIPQLRLRMVSFENTPENAVKILKNLGSSIDVVPGIFDHKLLEDRGCRGLTISMEPLCCAMPSDHPLERKKALLTEDLYGEKLLIIRRGWNESMDRLRNKLAKCHPEISLEEFPFYSMDVFNRCANEGCLLLGVRQWQMVHPLITVRPVRWAYQVPFGFLYPALPSEEIQLFLRAVKQVFLAVTDNTPERASWTSTAPYNG